MHHVSSLFSFFFYSSILFQMSSESPLIVLVFSAVSIVSNYVRMHARFTFPVFKIAAPHCLRYRPNAPFTVPVFYITSTVTNTARMQHLLSLFSKFPGGYPRSHAPPPCFSTIYISFFLLQLSFKIVSKGKL